MTDRDNLLHHLFFLLVPLRDEWGWNGLLLSDWRAVEELMAHGIAGTRSDAAALALRLDHADLHQLARNAFEASFLSADERARHLADLDAYELELSARLDPIAGTMQGIFDKVREPTGRGCHGHRLTVPGPGTGCSGQ